MRRYKVRGWAGDRHIIIIFIMIIIVIVIMNVVMIMDELFNPPLGLGERNPHCRALCRRCWPGASGDCSVPLKFGCRGLCPRTWLSADYCSSSSPSVGAALWPPCASFQAHPFSLSSSELGVSRRGQIPAKDSALALGVLCWKRVG